MKTKNLFIWSVRVILTLWSSNTAIHSGVKYVRKLMGILIWTWSQDTLNWQKIKMIKCIHCPYPRSFRHSKTSLCCWPAPRPLSPLLGQLWTQSTRRLCQTCPWGQRGPWGCSRSTSLATLDRAWSGCTSGRGRTRWTWCGRTRGRLSTQGPAAGCVGCRILSPDRSGSAQIRRSLKFNLSRH